jgi:hypothetical protein
MVIPSPPDLTNLRDSTNSSKNNLAFLAGSIDRSLIGQLSAWNGAEILHTSGRTSGGSPSFFRCDYRTDWA